ncbi:MAG: hypothetical protein K2P73_01090 [Lachnospiraceae bacterium]|nr:hypothetical protein [Lachnospiraceae bacterium]
MIATDNEYLQLQEASNTLFDLNADFNVRERCRNREEYYNVLRTFESEIDLMKEELAQSKNELIQSKNELVLSKNELVQKDLEIQKLQAELARMRSDQNA